MNLYRAERSGNSVYIAATSFGEAEIIFQNDWGWRPDELKLLSGSLLTMQHPDPSSPWVEVDNLGHGLPTAAVGPAVLGDDGTSMEVCNTNTHVFDGNYNYSGSFATWGKRLFRLVRWMRLPPRPAEKGGDIE